MTGTEWNTKVGKVQQDFLWALGHEATHQKTQIPNTKSNRTEKKHIKKFKHYNRQCLLKKSNTKLKEILWGETNRHRNTGRPQEKFDWMRKKCDFPEFSTELLISKFITSITDRKLREKLLKENDLDVPKVVQKIQHFTYDRKNKGSTLPEALKSNWEKNQRGTQTQNNTYRKLRNKTEKDTKRTKLLILRCIKLGGILRTNVQVENQYAITAQKGILQKPPDLNTENNKNSKILRNPKRSKKAIPTNR